MIGRAQFAPLFVPFHFWSAMAAGNSDSQLFATVGLCRASSNLISPLLLVKGRADPYRTLTLAVINLPSSIPPLGSGESKASPGQYLRCMSQPILFLVRAVKDLWARVFAKRFYRPSAPRVPWE